MAAPGVALQTAHIAKVWFFGLRRSQLTRMAAALSYRTIFGLIPVLVVGLVMLTAYASKDDRKQVVVKLLQFSGLSQIALDQPEIDPATVAMPLAGGMNAAAWSDLKLRAIGQKDETGLNGAQRLDQWISDIVERVGTFQFGLVGLVGLITLVYAAVSMMVEIEQAFNTVCGAPEGRSWLRRIPLYWTMLTLGSIFLASSFAVGEWFRTEAARLTDFQAISQFRETWISVLGFMTTWWISTLLLLLVYMTVPNTRMRILPALFGAAFAAALWESGKWAFRSYIDYSTGYARLYGSIALIPLFLLWIYLTWLIVLVGLQLAHSLQAYRAATRDGLTHSVLVTLGLAEDRRPPRTTMLVDPASILLVLASIAERFRTARRAERSAVAQDSGLEEATATELLQKLVGAGVVCRVADAEHESYVLARSPETISAQEVLALSDPPPQAASPCAAKLIGQLNEVRMRALQGRTLADLLAESAPPTPAEGDQGRKTPESSPEGPNGGPQPHAPMLGS